VFYFEGRALDKVISKWQAEDPAKDKKRAAAKAPPTRQARTLDFRDDQDYGDEAIDEQEHEDHATRGGGRQVPAFSHKPVGY